MSDSLRPQRLQHARLPRPSLSPEVCSNSHPLSQWCHLTICHPLSFCLQSFPVSRSFSNELAFHIRWPKYWSVGFIINPSSEYSGLISFRIDWFDLLAVQETLESFPVPQLKSMNSSVLSLLGGLTLPSVHDSWKNHSFDYIYRPLSANWWLWFSICHLKK